MSTTPFQKYLCIHLSWTSKCRNIPKQATNFLATKFPRVWPGGCKEIPQVSKDNSCPRILRVRISLTIPSLLMLASPQSSIISTQQTITEIRCTLTLTHSYKTIKISYLQCWIICSYHCLQTEVNASKSTSLQQERLSPFCTVNSITIPAIPQPKSILIKLAQSN